MSPGRALALWACLATLPACGEDTSSREAVHAYAEQSATCISPRERPAEAELRTSGGLAVLVRAPANYRPEVAHPLLVVFAGAGMMPRATERLTGFTPEATASGHVVAYPQHIRPSRAALRKLAAVPALVARHFCIDETHIVLSGHSDGGTTATALALDPDAGFGVRALAPSAAGFTGADLQGFECAAPTPVRVMHGARDTLFPGWGREAWLWWSACNGCDPESPISADGGCITHAACAVPTAYCEVDGGHTHWPEGAARATIDFFDHIGVGQTSGENGG
ncbi:MAG: poly(3-hydroxybutyrate) depolymerase [Gammaproteobacteria bacterium]|nr:poly(3-hydroxybutyrate) depolymerase [Gammaproteobacteria bacterium]